MRYFECGECIDKKDPGTRQIHERSEIGEPAEFERVVKGIARAPKPEQRSIAVNGVSEMLSLDFYNCDLCNAAVKPGDPCGTWTVWTEAMGPIGAWEHEYLEPADESLAQGAGPRAAAGKS